ncbi:MAG: hypothetical protein HZB41_09105 [Ignavibacteriae bacterium]|nr:hypothetical protein [Ignavibacteriota bacterium]
MKKNHILNKLFTFLFIFLIITSCSENVSYNEDAIKLTVKEITSTQLNKWFENEMNDYNPDTNVVNEIKNNFDTNRHKIYLYANFACGCTDQQTDIAHLCKVFSKCNIPESSFEIYSMSNKNSKHPYKNKFTINYMPECIVMKDTTAVYFVIDTMRYLYSIGSSETIEKLLLNGLKK